MEADRSGGQCDVRRVLVVDDHPDTTEVLAVLFRLMGYETKRALRGRDAMKSAREFDPELIVLDIGLPDISGFEVVNALRADPRMRDRYIVAVTGYSRPQDRARAQQAGFDDYFVKPIDLAKIRQILRLAASRARATLAACTNATRAVPGPAPA
jgi:CheY-like chemotaxis protein